MFLKETHHTQRTPTQTWEHCCDILSDSDSFEIQRETVGASEGASEGASGQIDPHFNNNELEWKTKRRGVICLYGLCVKMEGTTDFGSLIGFLAEVNEVVVRVPLQLLPFSCGMTLSVLVLSVLLWVCLWDIFFGVNNME